jgi:hypothetical protein
MRVRILIPIAVLAFLLVAGAAISGPRDTAMHVTRLGGNSVLAQPYVDRFLRYVENAVGWTPSTMKGSFLVTKKNVLEFIAKAKPGMAIMEPPLYFEYRKAWQLEPIVQLESKDLVSERLHLVVKDAAFKELADLKGKRLWTTLADYPAYLSRIVLGGQVDAARHFRLSQVGQAMKGARGVLRGDCEAVILDDDQFAEAKKIEGGKALRTIYDSQTLPALPVVVFGAAFTPKEREAMAKTLMEMCGTPKGGAICKKMRIGRFAPLNTPLFNSIQKRYGD